MREWFDSSPMMTDNDNGHFGNGNGHKMRYAACMRVNDVPKN